MSDASSGPRTRSNSQMSCCWSLMASAAPVPSGGDPHVTVPAGLCGNRLPPVPGDRPRPACSGLHPRHLRRRHLARRRASRRSPSRHRSRAEIVVRYLRDDRHRRADDSEAGNVQRDGTQRHRPRRTRDARSARSVRRCRRGLASFASRSGGRRPRPAPGRGRPSSP